MVSTISLDAIFHICAFNANNRWFVCVCVHGYFLFVIHSLSLDCVSTSYTFHHDNVDFPYLLCPYTSHNKEKGTSNTWHECVIKTFTHNLMRTSPTSQNIPFYSLRQLSGEECSLFLFAFLLLFFMPVFFILSAITSIRLSLPFNWNHRENGNVTTWINEREPAT